MIIIGVDPDSSANGVAIYVCGTLYHLKNMDTVDFYQYLEGETADIQVHLEDVCGNRCSSFGWHKSDSIRVKAKKSESVGKCKQAQIEVERVCEALGVPVVKHKVSSMWKDQAGKKKFEKVTGWNRRSNPDTRSAAYFGWLGATSKTI